MREVALILEGGGSKGAFTVGVIDCLLENGINLDYVIGVSAGAMNALNYVSKQLHRGRESTINLLKENDLISVKNLIKNKSIVNLNLIFDKVPNEIIPFDYETFFNSSTRCLITVTNIVTGKAEYLEEKYDKNRLMQILRASMSLPFFMPIVELDGKKYLDGGISDSIPYNKAYKDGYKKQIVVMTKNIGYRKSASNFSRNSAIIFYNKYPNFVKCIVNRHKMYNKQIQEIEKLEENGEIIVIRPTHEMQMSRLENDFDKLDDLYNQGYEITKSMMDSIKKYIYEK